eukprot:sb/3473362/
MPNTLNTHTTQDGITQFGVLKVDWTTRSLGGEKLPPIQPPPSSANHGELNSIVYLSLSVHYTHHFQLGPSDTMREQVGAELFAKKKRGTQFPKITGQNSRSDPSGSNYVMRVVSDYLSKEIREEMEVIKCPGLMRDKVCTTPVLPAMSRTRR